MDNNTRLTIVSIAQATRDNDHTEAANLVARLAGDDDAVNELLAIQREQMELGYMPRDLGARRDALRVAAAAALDPDVAAAVQTALQGRS